MSWEARSAADEISMQHKLKPVQRLILDRMADSAGKLGEGIYPSISTLALKTGLGESTIYRAIQFFLKVGILEYGDPALVAFLPADKRPRVYNMIFDAATRARITMRKAGRMPWQRKKPVDKSPAKPERGVTGTNPTPPAGCHSDRQTVNHLKINHVRPPADAVPASPEVVDYEAGLAYRLMVRERRLSKQQGLVQGLPVHARQVPEPLVRSLPADVQGLAYALP